MDLTKIIVRIVLTQFKVSLHVCVTFGIFMHHPHALLSDKASQRGSHQ